MVRSRYLLHTCLLLIFLLTLAGAPGFPPVPEDPLTLSLETMTQMTTVPLSVYSAAQEALQGFRSDTHKSTPKTFIVTGNPLPWTPSTTEKPAFFGIGIQKLIQWRFMHQFAASYSKENIRCAR
jgi:hypothetical protein